MSGAHSPGVTPLFPKALRGLFAFILLSTSAFHAYAQPAGLVVNEVSQGTSGSREWAELVVVGPPCSTVDLRGWILDDNNGIFLDCPGPNSGALSGTGIAPGHVRFKFDPVWQEVPVGTIILVYAFDPNDTGAQAEIGPLTPDYSDSNCDFVRVVPLNTSNTFMEMDVAVPTGASSGCCPNGVNGNPNYTGAVYVALNNQGFSGLSLNNNGDAFQTRNPGANFFHGLSYGAPTTTGCVPQPQFDGGPDGIQIPTTGSNITYQFRNTVNDDYTNVANFQNFPANSTQSPGRPNNCDNAQWIGSLRRPPESIFETSGAACVPNPSATSQSLCVGQTITLTLPNTNTCTSNSYSWNFSGSGSVSVQGSSTNSTITLLATGAGTVNAAITATISNSLLYTQGGCSGPQFPESLTYNFPLVVSPGPTANPTTVSACNQGNGTAIFNLSSANNIVNGNTGLPVSWFQNAAATIPINNPSAYTSGPGTVYAVVTSGPCVSNPVPVTLVVLPVPVAFPTSLAGCNQGNGQGAYNLTSINSIVNGNSGLTVNYWLGPGATNPISNPSNYVGGPGTIFATVSSGTCTSAPVPIALTVVPTPTTANTFITVNPLIACGTANVTVTFFFPSNNLYNVTLQYGAQTFNGQNLGNGASANFSISQNTGFTLVSVTLAQNSLCTVNFSNPPTINVTILDPPNLAITGDTVICAGESVNLSAIVTELNNPPGAIPLSFHSAQPPTAGNQINPLVSPGVTTTYYAFANGGAGCQQTLPVTIAVTQGGTPVLGNATVCENDPPLDLSTLLDPNYPNGTWSGPGVTGDSFDPAGLTGVQTLTFTPDVCGDPATTTVEVLTAGMPVLSPDTLCQTDPPLDLLPLQDPNFPNGSWSGAGVTGTTFDPAGQSGPVSLVFTPTGLCADPGTTEILVLLPDTPSLALDTLCSSEGLYDLHAVLDPAFPDGSWSGPGVSDTLFDPSLFSADTLVTLTFTPSASCSAPATTTIFVNGLIIPVLGTATLCDTDPPLDLSTLEDTLYVGGIWSGPGVTGSSFDPAGLAGSIELSYVFNGFCIDTAITTLVVVPGGTPVLGAASICEIGGPFDLTALQDPLYPSGTWSGPGVTGNTFDPAGQSGDVTLTFSPAGACANDATTTIMVSPMGQPILGNATVCQNEGTLDLSTLQDPAFPDGTWSGPGVSGAVFDPAGLSDTITLTFTPADTCLLAANTEIAVFSEPAYANLIESCDPSNTTYTVSFDISGGIPGTYTIDGLPVGSSFTSAPIASGDAYSFTLDDGSGCGPVVISGQVTCNCTTFSGTLDTGAGPIDVCEGESTDISLFFNNDNTLDANDVLFFILHDQPGAPLGNIVQTSPDGLFSYPAGIVPLQSYYISAVAGDSDGAGGIDFTDPCLSVSAGIEVIFHAMDVSFGPGGSICETDCFDWEFTIEGANVLEYLVTVNGVGFPFSETISAPGTYPVTLCPSGYGISSGTITLTPVSISDGVCTEDLSGLPPIVIEIFANSQTLIDPVLCPGESLMVNGTTYDEGNPAGVEVISGSNFNGCDSTITVNLSFFPPSQSGISQTLCEGESLVVNGVVYDENNPSGVELIPGGSFTGCDSTITVNLIFLPESSSSITTTLCDGESVTVNGMVYNQGNPSGTEVMQNYLGCDSTITVSLSFFPPANGSFSTTLCPGETVTINGTVYGQANPSGTEIIPNGSYSGCDSTVTVSLSFFPPSNGMLSQSLCEGESIVINGTTYDEGNPSGTEIFPGGAWTGCDSTLQVNLSFIPLSANLIDTALCIGESFVVNGVVYDASNPVGSEVFPGGSYTGCDSLVVISLNFFPPANGTLVETLCAEDFLVINGTVYDVSNPSGTEFLPGGSGNGCDSTLTITLTFLDPVVFELTDTLAPGQFITVNGTIYNEGNPSGTEVVFNGSYQGCDSTIIVNLFFDAFELAFEAIAPSCYGFQDGQLIIESISGGKPPYSVSLDGLFFEPAGAFPFTLNDLSAGVYTLTIEDGNGETYTLTVVIPSKPEPSLDLGPDLALDLGESIELTATTNFAIAQIIWAPGDYLDCDTCVVVTLQQPGENITYTVTAFDADGCLVTDVLNVEVRKPRNVFVPNIFSPNGDGLNDLLMVFGGREVRQIRQFQVYNRWGGKMYEASNFQPNDPVYGWDGNFRGRKMDAGVYVFYIEVEFIDGDTEMVKGGVTLVR
jgi:gliding motility-associated-like protein